MKAIKLIRPLLLIFTLNSCNFNQSVNKDLITGAYTRGNGIGCGEVIIQINGATQNRNSFIYGEKVNIIFQDVSGLTKLDGKVYPCLSMYIVKNGMDTVFDNSNLLTSLKDGTDLSPLQLQAKFTSVLPFENDEKYKVFIKIRDIKGEGFFTYELPFSVEGNKLLQINSKDLEYTNIYLWDETAKQILVDKNVNMENTLILLLEGLDGMEIVNGKVYPAFSIDLKDKGGKRILSDSNVLSEYENKGVDYEVFKRGQLPVSITFTPGKINNPCKLSASLTDFNSNKRIDIEAELEIK